MDPDAQTSELVGSVLGGRYKIIRRMGAGGMGAVYEALQEDLNRRVAVKVLHPHLALDADLVERFKREAQAAAALGHPNIVHVTDFQVSPGQQPFLVMEYLTGKSFRELMKEEKRLPPKRTAFIATQILSALAAAHEAKIVHRDIKPDNIFLSSTSAMKDLVKVLDFGIAKLLTDEGPLTMAGTVLGTLSYMAPEQARGEVIDGRADLYAVGACMYYAISGKRPLEAPDRSDLHAAVQLTEPQPLALACPEIDPRLGKIVDRALRKLPEDRFASAQEMAEAITAWLKPAGSIPAASEVATLPEPGPPTVVNSPSQALTSPEVPSPASLAPATQAASPQARPVSERPVSARAPQPRTMLSAQAPDVPALLAARQQVTQPLAQAPVSVPNPVSVPLAETLPMEPGPPPPPIYVAPSYPPRAVKTESTSSPWLWVILGVGSLLFIATAIVLGIYVDGPATPAPSKAQAADLPSATVATATATATTTATATSGPASVPVAPTTHHVTTPAALPATPPAAPAPPAEPRGAEPKGKGKHGPP